MGTQPTTFRPRNGASAEAYWRIRVWCEREGFTFSDVLNALMVPVSYCLDNHCEVDRVKSMASVILNIGDLNILHVFQGKCYPLATAVPSAKEATTLEEMKEKVAYWEARNAARPTQYDLMLLQPPVTAPIPTPTNTYAKDTKTRTSKKTQKVAAN